MADFANDDCGKQFEQVAPKGPWDANTSVRQFEPLINLIDAHTQSDMFRRVGKYEKNDDYYDMAAALNDGTGPATKTFANGVTASITQKDGDLTKLEIVDEAAHSKEVATFNEFSHGIETDKVTYCGVSRERKFSEQGEVFRAYGFSGGSVDNKVGVPRFVVGGDH